MSFFTLKKRIRRNFGKIPGIAEIPNLIQVQKKSYEDFLQSNVLPEKRKNCGLEGVLRSIFPVSDNDGVATLEYVGYELGTPKYDIDESIQRGVNYAAPLRLVLRLIVWDIDEEIGTKEVKSIKEQSVYMGEIPLMTESGTFVINGAQRVIVSQMHRSPGVFYYHDEGKGNTAGKYLYYARIIPYRGSWLDFEFDAKDLMYFRIDRKRKMYVSTLLRAFGYTGEQILREFYSFKTYRKLNNLWVTEFEPEDFKGVKVLRDVVDSENHEVIIKSGTKVTPNILKKLKEKYLGRSYFLSHDDIIGSYAADVILDQKTGEEIISLGKEFTDEIIKKIEAQNINEISVLSIDNIRSFPYMRNTMMADKNLVKDDAIADIYKILRPGEPVATEIAEDLLNTLFFSSDRYDLSNVGRMKINVKHNLNISEDLTVLTKEDILAVVKYMIAIKDGFGEIDDIDSLSNRRVRSVGELVGNQFMLGLVKMGGAMRERMNTVEKDTVMPHDLVNSKMLMSVIKEFFGTSQLSQFMDQTNPLAEITHKRRFTALGPGGLTKERAGFEARDVHPSHYGRICPIETPEGPSIGLINSIAVYAKVNKYGFVESPYRRVVDGKVTNIVDYLSAIEESKHTIAQANAPLHSDGSFAIDKLKARRKGEYVYVSVEEITYVDVSPKQMVSVAASLIPFLENDDANRALMGSNMQRQAVPLLRSEAPLVGTGMEEVVVRDSIAVVIAKRDGVVEYVDSRRIVIRSELDDGSALGVDIYTLTKFQKSNQGTVINQRPIVNVGDKILKGDIIADGSCTDLGELALGKNILVAFMPWNGYNFEDSILISERVSKKDIFTSIYVEEVSATARDTRLGPEEITRDIPNVGEEHLKHLDEVGIVHIGARVEPGDILVGKVVPKTESPLTPEEKLLRAIFGEKAKDVKDSSLRVPPGGGGVVVGVRIFVRRGVEKDGRAIALERLEIEKVSKDKEDQINIIDNFTYNKVKELLIGKIVASDYRTLKSGKKLEHLHLSDFPRKQWWNIVIDDQDTMISLEKMKNSYDASLAEIEAVYKNKVEKIQSGDDLPQGALKVVKVYIAKKLKLQPGDKMAGRHGNKGVVSKIVPSEDMPFLEDGTPVDIVLNPLGVPSRMNVGQILETHLGWASANLGKQISDMLERFHSENNEEQLRDKLKSIYNSDRESDISACNIINDMGTEELKILASNLSKGVPFATPVFDGVKEQEMNELMVQSGVDSSGQVSLIDGRSGEYFDRKVTVGYLYMLKLDHLVENKIHARSIGPYSLVTQQPLGGKSHFGGQRFGEMEFWGLKAFGAVYILIEMITVKSDDITGRIKIYESIVRSDTVFECGVPESFNVMIKELRSLALNVEMI